MRTYMQSVQLRDNRSATSYYDFSMSRKSVYNERFLLVINGYSNTKALKLAGALLSRTNFS